MSRCGAFFLVAQPFGLSGSARHPRNCRSGRRRSQYLRSGPLPENRESSACGNGCLRLLRLSLLRTRQRSESSGELEIFDRVWCLSSDRSIEKRVKGDHFVSSNECLSSPGKPLRSPATQPAILAFAVVVSLQSASFPKRTRPRWRCGFAPALRSGHLPSVDSFGRRYWGRDHPAPASTSSARGYRVTSASSARRSPRA